MTVRRQAFTNVRRVGRRFRHAVLVPEPGVSPCHVLNDEGGDSLVVHADLSLAQLIAPRDRHRTDSNPSEPFRNECDLTHASVRKCLAWLI